MARSAEIIPATAEHIPHIVANIREADLEEMALLSWTPGPALRVSLKTALAAWTGTVDGIPVCIFGVSPGGFFWEGRVWMIGTKDLDRYAFTFLRRCKPRIAEMLTIAPVLTNYVSAANTKAIQWLRWLGFTIEPAVPLGPKSAPFHPFSLKGE